MDDRFLRTLPIGREHEEICRFERGDVHIIVLLQLLYLFDLQNGRFVQKRTQMSLDHAADMTGMSVEAITTNTNIFWDKGMGAFYAKSTENA